MINAGGITMSWETIIKRKRGNTPRFKPPVDARTIPHRFRKATTEITKKVADSPQYVKTAWAEVERWLTENA
tara:strand:+ start:666 stop:881 length:216 start_codon:yes stop_codon:yes gene_type:complete